MTYEEAQEILNRKHDLKPKIKQLMKKHKLSS